MVPMRSTKKEFKMKRHICSLCFADAAYVSSKAHLALCEDCYTNMEDEYSASMEDEIGMSFDEYYEFEEID
jgi:hypothetical protein